MHVVFCRCYFFFNDTAPTEIYTLSLHDALPISRPGARGAGRAPGARTARRPELTASGSSVRIRRRSATPEDRKSTRLNSSHGYISYAVFCLKKKQNIPARAADICYYAMLISGHV